MKSYRSMVLVSSDPESISKGANEVFNAFQSEIKSFGLEMRSLCRWLGISVNMRLLHW